MGQHVARVVGVAHAHAAAGQHRIGFGHRTLQRCCSAAGSSATRPRSITSQPSAAARPSGCSGCCRRCSRGPAAGPGVRSSLPVENSATRKRRNTRTWPMPKEPTRPRSAGVKRRPARKAGLPGCQVLAAAAAVFTGLDDAGLDVHGVALYAAQFLRHHGVQPGGHNRAGHDAQALARAHLPGKGRAGISVPTLRSSVGAPRSQRGAGEGVAVHRRVVVRRHVDGRDHVGRQHAAQCLVQRLILALTDGLQGRVDGLARLATLRLLVARHQRGRAEFETSSKSPVRPSGALLSILQPEPAYRKYVHIVARGAGSENHGRFAHPVSHVPLAPIP
jgi:hypothetical protein